MSWGSSIFEIPLLNNSDNMSDLIKEYNQNLFIYNKIQNSVLIGIYIPTFLLSLIANIIVIIVVSRFKSLRSVTNYFLVNLSIADLLVTLICMPMAVGKAIHSLWIYGEIFCKLSNYMTGVAVGSSVFTISAMSIDRYIAIRHPMSRKIINRRTTCRVILIIWLLALITFSPILIIRKTQGFRLDGQDFLYCIEDWPNNISRRSFGIFCFIVIYFIPGFIVILSYSLMGLRLCSQYLLPEYQEAIERNSILASTTTASTASATSNPGNRTRVNLSRSRSNPGSNPNPSHQQASTKYSMSGERLISERRRVAKFLLIIAIVFSICWLPFSVLSLILDIKLENTQDYYQNENNHINSYGYSSYGHNETTIDSNDTNTYMLEWGKSELPSKIVEDQGQSLISQMLPFAILLGHLNSAISPLIYCILSKGFRKCVAEFLRHPIRSLRGKQQIKIRLNFRNGNGKGPSTTGNGIVDDGSNTIRRSNISRTRSPNISNRGGNPGSDQTSNCTSRIDSIKQQSRSRNSTTNTTNSPTASLKNQSLRLNGALNNGTATAGNVNANVNANAGDGNGRNREAFLSFRSHSPPQGNHKGGNAVFIELDCNNTNTNTNSNSIGNSNSQHIQKSTSNNTIVIYSPTPVKKHLIHKINKAGRYSTQSQIQSVNTCSLNNSIRTRGGEDNAGLFRKEINITQV